MASYPEGFVDVSAFADGGEELVSHDNVHLDDVGNIVVESSSQLLSSGSIVVAALVFTIAVISTVGGLIIFYQAKVINRKDERIDELSDFIMEFSPKMTEVLSETNASLKMLPAELMRLIAPPPRY